MSEDSHEGQEVKQSGESVSDGGVAAALNRVIEKFDVGGQYAGGGKMIQDSAEVQHEMTQALLRHA